MVEPVSKLPTQVQLIQAFSDIWVFADIIKFRGGRKKFGSIHVELSDFLTKPQQVEDFENRRRLILMPRGHLKSTVCSVLYTLWRIYRNPSIRILVGTNIKRLAKSFIRELRQYFEHGGLQREVWNRRPHVPGPLVPALSAADRRSKNSRRNNTSDDGEINLADDTKLIWSGEALQVNRPDILKEPTVQVTSAGTVVTGDHYDLLILDDIVDFSNSRTQELADGILDWTRDLESVLDPRQKYVYAVPGGLLVDYIGDEVVTLGTRYYDWDFYNYLITDAESLGIRQFSKNIYVNGYDETDGYIWPEKFNKSVIEGIRRRINNAQRFASQYLNTILAPEDATFSVDKLRWIDQNSIKASPDGTYEVRRPDGTYKRVQPQLFIDPAATVSATSDFTVLGVGGYDEDKNLIILDMVIGRLQPSQVTDELFKLCDKWRLHRVTVEMVGGFKLYSHVINTEMRRIGKILAIADYRPPHNLNKKARIEAWLEPLLTNGMLYISNGLAMNVELRNEFTLFPRGHDDVLDVIAALAEICKPTRKQGAVGASTPRRQINTRYGGNRA